MSKNTEKWWELYEELEMRYGPAMASQLVDSIVGKQITNRAIIVSNDNNSGQLAIMDDIKIRRLSNPL